MLSSGFGIVKLCNILGVIDKINSVEGSAVRRISVLCHPVHSKPSLPAIRHLKGCINLPTRQTLQEKTVLSIFFMSYPASNAVGYLQDGEDTAMHCFLFTMSSCL